MSAAETAMPSGQGPRDRVMQIDAELTMRIGRVQLVRNRWDAPIDRCGTADRHHLELSLLPRSGEPRGCFPDHWGPHRFEPMGDLFLLPAAQMFHARSRCRQQASLMCDFDPAAVGEWFDGDLRWTGRRLRSGLDITSGRVRQLMSAIVDELRAPGFASATMVELMAAQTMIELSRHLLGAEPAAGGGLARWRLRLIDERLAGERTSPSLHELAELCGVSVRHLTRAFRASRGCSIGEYLAAHRIDQAKQMLVAGDSVKAVAYTMGFTAPSNFAAAFRRATGVSPRQYQQRVLRQTRLRAALAH
jgi:AraC family transcriptional regulator